LDVLYNEALITRAISVTKFSCPVNGHKIIINHTGPAALHLSIELKMRSFEGVYLY